LLKAIAKDDKVSQPTGINFISKYNLGNASSVRRSLLSLIEKEMPVNKVGHLLKENPHRIWTIFNHWIGFVNGQLN